MSRSEIKLKQKVFLCCASALGKKLTASDITISWSYKLVTLTWSTEANYIHNVKSFNQLVQSLGS